MQYTIKKDAGKIIIEGIGSETHIFIGHKEDDKIISSSICLKKSDLNDLIDALNSIKNKLDTHATSTPKRVAIQLIIKTL